MRRNNFYKQITLGIVLAAVLRDRSDDHQYGESDRL